MARRRRRLIAKNFDFLLAEEKWERRGRLEGESLWPLSLVRSPARPKELHFILSEFVIYERCRRRSELVLAVHNSASAPCPSIKVRFLKVERATERGRQRAPRRARARASRQGECCDKSTLSESFARVSFTNHFNAVNILPRARCWDVGYGSG